MKNDYNKEITEAWKNLSSEHLRYVYWMLKLTEDKYLSEFDIFKMDTFKAILIQRLEW
jgi:hypothetical protein